MNIVLAEFKDRVQEINIYINFIEKLEENDKISNILKANCLLMIYNLVESTFTNGIEKIYSVLKYEKCTYQNICEKLQTIWFEYKFKNAFDPNSHFNTYKGKALEILTSILNQDIILLNKKATNINGNLDGDEIRKVCNSHGITLKILKSAQGGRFLSDVKEKRNSLAHGSISFSECGRDYTLNDLKGIKIQIVIFLISFIKSLETYLNKKEYLK